MGTIARTVGAHMALAAVVVGPALLSPSSRLVGNGDADVWNHAWGPWWWWYSLRQGHLPWQTDLLHAPVGGVLWFIDPILATAGAPLVPLMGPAMAFNLVVLGMVATSSWAAGRLARSLGASPSAAWVASGAYAASAWMVCELHDGITEAVDIGPLALALAWGEEACRASTVRAWLKAGAGIGVATLASPYLGLGAGIVLGIRGLAHLRHALPGAALATLIAALPLWLLRTQLGSPLAIVRRPAGMNESLAPHNAVDPRTFVVPGFRSVDLSAEGMEHSMYVGLAALLLAAVGVAAAPRRRLPWLLGSVAAGVASLGPWLFWDGSWVLDAQGDRITLPWMWLQQAVPGLAVTHPLRLAVAALAVVAALAAVGAERLLGRRALLLLPVVVADGLLLSGAPWPVGWSDATVPRALTSIAREPGEPPWAVLDLPTDVGRTMATSRYLFWQTAHARPIPYAVDARASTSMLLARPAFRELARLSSGRTDEDRRLGLDITGEARLANLAEVGVRWLVLHPDLDPTAAARIQDRIEAELGPGDAIDGALRWDLGEDAAALDSHIEQLLNGLHTPRDPKPPGQ